jgi:hypothetical protein
MSMSTSTSHRSFAERWRETTKMRPKKQPRTKELRIYSRCHCSRLYSNSFAHPKNTLGGLLFLFQPAAAAACNGAPAAAVVDAHSRSPCNDSDADIMFRKSNNNFIRIFIQSLVIITLSSSKTGTTFSIHQIKTLLRFFQEPTRGREP